MSYLSFVNNYPTLQAAVADTPAPLPGYIYEEVKAISFVSSPHCELLLRFLISRLDGSKSCHVKLRALRLTDYLLKNGNEEFGDLLRQQLSSIKAASGFNGPPDAVYGNKRYEMVRNVAKEIIKCLFDETSVEETKNNPVATSPVSGMGSTASNKTMEGFGNKPVCESQNVGDKMANEVSQMMETFKNTLSPTRSLRKAGGLSMDAVDKKFDLYDPPEIKTYEVEIPKTDVTNVLPSSVGKKSKTVRKPGRAGGGWDDEDVEESGSSLSSSTCNQVIDTADDSDIRVPAPDDYVSDDCDRKELNLVKSFLSDNQTCIPTVFELQEVCKRCETLNCEKIVGMIASEMERSSDDLSKMRLLILLEVLLHTDLVAPNIMYSAVHPSLKNMKLSCEPGALKSKSHKLCLIVEKLQNIDKTSNGNEDLIQEGTRENICVSTS